MELNLEAEGIAVKFWGSKAGAKAGNRLAVSSEWREALRRKALRQWEACNHP